MRNTKLIIGIILSVLIAATAFAAGNLPWNTGKPAVQIQNLKGIASKAGQSRCDTVTGTSAVQKTYSSAGYAGMTATVYDVNTGAPIVVKWYEDGQQVWVGSTYEGVNDQGKAFSSLKYAAFGNHTTGSCARRQ